RAISMVRCQNGRSIPCGRLIRRSQFFVNCQSMGAALAMLVPTIVRPRRCKPSTSSWTCLPRGCKASHPRVPSPGPSRGGRTATNGLRVHAAWAPCGATVSAQGRKALPRGRGRKRNKLLKASPQSAVTTTRSPGTLTSVRAPARQRSSWLENEAILGYVLMTPALLLIVVFIAYPFSLGVWLALTDKLVSQPAHFIGLRNFTHLFESQIFWTTVWNTVFFTFSATVLKAVLGMWLAVLLNRKIRFARFIRATVLLPFIVPTVL